VHRAAEALARRQVLDRRGAGIDRERRETD